MAYIKVDILAIKRCIGNKQDLEALAIAAFFKARYANSMIYSHTIREYKRIACMGSERLRRALDRARTLGLVRGKGNSLIVGNLHTGRNAWEYNCNEVVVLCGDCHKAVHHIVLPDKDKQQQLTNN